MKSDFAAAHLHLERACHDLRGDDGTSSEARAARDLLSRQLSRLSTHGRQETLWFPRLANLR